MYMCMYSEMCVFKTMIFHVLVIFISILVTSFAILHMMDVTIPVATFIAPLLMFTSFKT
jgi:hypothetical protein